MIADSPVSFNERDQVLECAACFDKMFVPRSALRDPEEFVSLLELTQLDHADCHKYKDVHMARNARRFRKESRRLLLLKPGNGVGRA